MIYYTFHIDDSGAIEDVDENTENGKTSLICRMYDDEEFNKLNDILHSLYDYILNKKALDIFTNSKTIPYELRNAKVIRKETKFGFLKMNKSYDYYQLDFLKENLDECYSWINFEKSEINALDNSNNNIKIQSHQQTLELIEQNKSDSKTSYDFVTKKVVFGNNFDSEIDLFKIPLYSWGVYVSERLKNKLEKEKITDIGFAENKERLGAVWKPHFPVIEFEN